MSVESTTLLDTIGALSPGLGAVLRKIYASKRGRVPQRVPVQELVSEMGQDSQSHELVLQGALAILHSMGVVHLEGEAVKATSRNAGFFLGSLSKFLDEAVAAINDPLDSLGDYSRLTHVYETARRRRDQEAAVNQDPLHHRHIVNVIINSRMKRNWALKDVYLHEYHRDWKMYHLIGDCPEEGSPEPTLESDRRVAETALRDHLSLHPSQYDFDTTINPDVICLRRISETNGAYTEYTYRLVVAKRIRPRLDRDEHLKENRRRGPFRWFTADEIEAGQGSQGERVIFSTPGVMTELKDQQLLIAAPRADDVRQRAGIWRELGYRYTRQQLSIPALALVVLLVLPFLPWLGSRFADRPLPLLANVANLVESVFYVMSVAAMLGALIFASLRGSRQ